MYLHCPNGWRDKRKELRAPQKDWSEKIQFGTVSWRKPKPPLLIALFAKQIGDPKTPPTPPVWNHLGLAILCWKHQIKLSEVVELGSKLGQKEQVARGLAIVAHIFPEIADWVQIEKLSLPKWEKKYAISLAARKLTQGIRD